MRYTFNFKVQILTLGKNTPNTSMKLNVRISPLICKKPRYNRGFTD